MSRIEQEPVESWLEFVDKNRVALASIEKSVVSEKKELANESAEALSEQIFTSFFDALDPNRESFDPPIAKDFQLLRRAVNAIVECRRDDVLTDEEAEAVLNFLFGRFVERRFNRTIRRMLPHHGGSKNGHVCWLQALE